MVIIHKIHGLTFLVPQKALSVMLPFPLRSEKWILLPKHQLKDYRLCCRCVILPYTWYTYFLPRVYNDVFRSRAHFKKQRKWGSTFPEREHSYKHKQGKSQVTITNKCYQYIFVILLTAGGDANLVELGII